MDAAEFILVAGKIVSLGAAGARSAISRAYYGAFHLARELLDDLGCGIPKSGPSHALVPEMLMACSHPQARLAGRLLSDLHQDRIRADYRLEQPAVESREFAMQSVESAMNVRDHLEMFQIDCQTDPTIRADLLTAVEAIKKARQIR